MPSAEEDIIEVITATLEGEETNQNKRSILFILSLSHST
jgi:hypothetical protein